MTGLGAGPGGRRPSAGPIEPVRRRGAIGAQPEQLDPVRIDDVARPGLDLAGDRVHAAVLDLGAPAAALADDVVVMGGLADHVRVFAVGQVKTLDQAELLEQLERQKDRRTSDAESAALGLSDQIERGEMVGTLGHHLGDDPPRLGDVVAGIVQRVGQRNRITHGQR